MRSTERIGTVAPFPPNYSPAHFIEKHIGELSSLPMKELWARVNKLLQSGDLSYPPSKEASAPELARVILQVQFTIQTSGKATKQGAKKMPPKKTAPKSEPETKSKTKAKASDEPSEQKAGPGRQRRHQPDQKIKVLVKENPKRPNSDAAERFDLYTNGMTVQEYVDAGGRTADIAWDEKRGFISVT